MLELKAMCQPPPWHEFRYVSLWSCLKSSYFPRNRPYKWRFAVTFHNEKYSQDSFSQDFLGARQCSSSYLSVPDMMGIVVPLATSDVPRDCGNRSIKLWRNLWKQEKVEREHTDWLVQECRNSIANALELRLLLTQTHRYLTFQWALFLLMVQHC